VDVLQIAIPNPEHAPYGAAAKTMLEQLGLWSKLQPKTVLAENVRMAYQYAQTRNVDAVITSWTLLINEKGAHLLPEKLHPPLRQFGAVVKGTAQESRARAFLAFLLSPAGAKILEAGGLFPPAAKAR
jgi:molybdate transport system substrate-binding protein